MADRGQRKSRFRNPASTVARWGLVVDKFLADSLDEDFATESRNRGPRGAAWSNMNPGRGFGLKKQTLSDCDLRNLSNVDDGAGTCNADRIAAREVIAIDNYDATRSSVTEWIFLWIYIYSKLGHRNFVWSHDKANASPNSRYS